MNEHFFDYNSTTPVAPEALKAMIPFFSDIFANPSGQTSQMSWQSQSAIKFAKKEISTLLNCSPQEITFTSGATESINWVFKNFIEEKKNVLVSDIDHDAAWETQKDSTLKKLFTTDDKGQILSEKFIKRLQGLKKGSLVSFIHAHNELGTILKFKELIPKIKELGHFIHLDATQSVGKTPIDFKDLNIDFLSLSAHKIYGPKGIGLLLINNKSVVKFKPFISGGGQQENLRSGTLNTPLIVGFGSACSLAKKNLLTDQKHYKNLRSIFLNEFNENSYTLNQDPSSYLFNTINITFKNWKNPSPLYLELLPFSVSQSSACASEKAKPRVLSNLGVSYLNTLRISFGRQSSPEGCIALANKLKKKLI